MIKGARLKNYVLKCRTKRVDNVEYYFDELITDNNSLFIKGWILSVKGENISPSIKFVTADETVNFDVKLHNRDDVCNALGVESVECGFQFEASFKSNKVGRIYLQYMHNGAPRKIVIGAFTGDEYSEKLAVNRVISGIASYKEVCSSVSSQQLSIPDRLYDFCVDIIVPVYNGFEYLETLFKTIEGTKMKYRLFIVNDKSPDERVMPFLTNYAKNRENVVLLENSVNLGFVQTVNKAMTISDCDVAIVNTDVILPENWLERLMLPIIMRNDVASSTPFTNSGTICSFPNFCDNNEIFMGLGVDKIDNEFAKLKAVYNEMPTGVGFCMGMKRNVINKIGLFDAETFYKGYGEENDWCQKAILNGYKNVMVENLFVWHKHGGSFLSEDKKRYIERNSKLLLERYPKYDSDVALYCRRDPVKNIREYVKWQLMWNKAENNYVVFNHNWGGGASTYLEDKIKSIINDSCGIIQIINDVNSGLIVEYRYKGYKVSFGFESFDEIFELIKDVKCDNIILNELVSFNNIEEVQKFVLKLKECFKAELTMLGHDFYGVCPSIYLVDKDNKHCFTPNIEYCRQCFGSNKNKFNNKCQSVDKWRELWKDFLQKCDKIIFFSNNTRSYFEYWYGKMDNMSVVPHQVDYIEPVRDYQKTTDKVTIAIIGNLMKTKGSDVIYEMSDIIKKNKINAEIVVIGPDLDNCKDKDIKIHGRYKREELPQLIEKYEADVVFIASIWPETFSYTAEEAMKMNVPVASFNIGAPAERIVNYDKGIIISSISAETALNEILEYLNNK